MLLKIGTVVFFAGIAAGMEPRKEPETYTPETVEKFAAYPPASVARLISVAEPPAAPAPQTITGDRRITLEEKLRVTAARFGVNLTGPIAWTPDTSTYAIHRSEDGGVFMAYFDSRDEITSIHLTGSELPDNGTKMVTPKMFEGYARECYRKAFGSAPVGTVEFQRQGSGLKESHDESARWKVSVEGVPMRKLGTVAASMNGESRWSLNCTKGPTATDVEALAGILRHHPTRITAEQAMATAWKTWKELRAPAFAGNDFIIACDLREVTREEKEPWGNGLSLKTERLAWINGDKGPVPGDPVFYEVRITRSLFEVNALVDRQTGRVLRMNQGRMQW